MEAQLVICWKKIRETDHASQIRFSKIANPLS